MVTIYCRFPMKRGAVHSKYKTLKSWKRDDCLCYKNLIKMKALCRCRGLSCLLPDYLLSKWRELGSAKPLAKGVVFLRELLAVREEAKHKGSQRRGWGTGEGTEVLHHFWVIHGWLNVLGLWFQHSKTNTVHSSKGNFISHCLCWATMWCPLWGEVRR